jgi:hypothetical protein
MAKSVMEVVVEELELVGMEELEPGEVEVEVEEEWAGQVVVHLGVMDILVELVVAIFVEVEVVVEVLLELMVSIILVGVEMVNIMLKQLQLLKVVEVEEQVVRITHVLGVVLLMEVTQLELMVLVVVVTVMLLVKVEALVEVEEVLVIDLTTHRMLEVEEVVW